MCGVVGVFPLNKIDLQIASQLRRALTLWLHNEILFETEVRGKDATGISLSFGLPYEPIEGQSEKFWAVLKQPAPAKEFFANNGLDPKYRGQEEDANIERLMDVGCLLQRPLNHVIGHTRKKTTGSEFKLLNNHPILVGNIIGVHNGGVANYKEIYKLHPEMTQQGEVDSEAIFQLLALEANERRLTAEDIKFTTEKLEGDRAVIAYNRLHPETVIYFRNAGRPLELAYIEELGIAVLCSEKSFLDTTLRAYARAKLTLKRDLPDLSVDWVVVPSDTGGIIDVTTEITWESTLEEIFPTTVSCNPTLEGYKKATTFSTIVNRHHHPSVIAPKVTSIAPTPPRMLTAAVLNDLSGYGEDEEEEVTEVQRSVIATASIVDDNDTDNEDTSISEVYPSLNADESTSSIIDLYNLEDLRRHGVAWILSDEAKNDATLIINKKEGALKDLFTDPYITETIATETLQEIYPDIFSEGYAVGFTLGAQEQLRVSEENQTESEDDTATISSLTNALIKERNKQKKAATVIANMKAFIMAAVITGEIGHIEKYNNKSRLVFNTDLEDFLVTAKGFNRVNPDMIRRLIKDKDLKTITNGFLSLSQELNTDEAFAEDTI